MITGVTTRGRVLPALVIVSVLAVAAAQPAAAQSAKDLKCNGCVNSKDIKNNGVTSKDIKNGQVKNADLGNNAVTGGKIAAGAVGNSDLANDAVTGGKIADGAVAFGKLTTSMQQRITDLEAAAAAPVTSFAVGLDLEEATLGTNGPLEIFLRCRVNDAGNDRIQFVGTSTQAGWFKSGDSTARVAGEEVMLLSLSTPMGSVSFGAIGGVGVSAADGSTLTLPFTNRGFNAFNHVCTASGTAIAIGPIP